MPKGTKQAVLKMIERMPEQSSVEDIMYELYFRQRVDRRLTELAAGKTISHEQVKRSITKWRKSAGR
jgi:predicted CopG family antitoxin